MAINTFALQQSRLSSRVTRCDPWLHKRLDLRRPMITITAALIAQGLPHKGLHGQ